MLMVTTTTVKIIISTESSVKRRINTAINASWSCTHNNIVWYQCGDKAVVVDRSCIGNGKDQTLLSRHCTNVQLKDCPVAVRVTHPPAVCSV